MTLKERWEILVGIAGVAAAICAGTQVYYMVHPPQAMPNNLPITNSQDDKKSAQDDSGSGGDVMPWKPSGGRKPKSPQQPRRNPDGVAMPLLTISNTCNCHPIVNHHIFHTATA